MINNLSLSITIKFEDNKYSLHALDDGYSVGFFESPYSAKRLQQILNTANEKIHEIVTSGYYNTKLDIPSEYCKRDLKKIAQLNLIEHIFIHPGSPSDAREFIEYLKRLSKNNKLHIQIIANKHFVPWSLFYTLRLLSR